MPALLDDLPQLDRHDRAALAAPSLVLLTSSAVALGFAIHIRDGEYWNVDPSRPWTGSIFWVAVSLVCCVAGVAWKRPIDPSRGEPIVVAALSAGLAFQIYQLMRSPPSGWNEWSNDLAMVPAPNLRFFYGGIAAAALFTGAAGLAAAKLRQVCVALVLLTHLLLGVWMVRSSPSPAIDVFHFQQESARALLAGRNPYAVRMPDIYSGTKKGVDRAVYGEGLSREGTLDFGFPYTPLSLLLSTAGYGATGDHRYAQVVALTLAGALLAYARGGRTGLYAAALLLFTPRAFFILGRGWTEPFVVLGLAAMIFVACRKPRWLPLALGLFLATKQYLIFAAPAMYLLAPRPFAWWPFLRFVGLSIGVAALVTVPMALWDPRAFLHSTVTVQEVAPFRKDALSFLVWYYFRTGVEPGVTAAFVAMAVGVVIALWRAPRGPAGFAGALALTYLPFMAFNKQAFANYYLFALACLCAAVAASPYRAGGIGPGIADRT